MVKTLKCICTDVSCEIDHGSNDGKCPNDTDFGLFCWTCRRNSLWWPTRCEIDKTTGCGSPVTYRCDGTEPVTYWCKGHSGLCCVKIEEGN